MVIESFCAKTQVRLQLEFVGGIGISGIECVR